MQHPVIENILQRSSVRKYTEQKVEPELLKILEQVAMASPTACNFRAIRYTFITDSEVIADISKAKFADLEIKGDHAKIKQLKERHDSVLFAAPLYIIISGPQDDKYRYTDIDAGIGVQSLCLAAKALGLESCIINNTKEVFAKDHPSQMWQKVKLPAEHEFFTSVVIGYGAKEKKPHEFEPSQIYYLED